MLAHNLNTQFDDKKHVRLFKRFPWISRENILTDVAKMHQKTLRLINDKMSFSLWGQTFGIHHYTRSISGGNKAQNGFAILKIVICAQP